MLYENKFSINLLDLGTEERQFAVRLVPVFITLTSPCNESNGKPHSIKGKTAHYFSCFGSNYRLIPIRVAFLRQF